MPKSGALHEVHKRLITQCGDYRANAIDPTHYGGVDTKQRPETLS